MLLRRMDTKKYYDEHTKLFSANRENATSMHCITASLVKERLSEIEDALSELICEDGE